MDEGQPVIHVLEVGASMVKTGPIDKDGPTHVFPSLLLFPSNKQLSIGMRHYWWGNQAMINADDPEAPRSWPVEGSGYITNWDDMEKLYHNTFYNELRIAPEEHPVFVPLSPALPRDGIERVEQIMFETFNTPALFLESSARCALYHAVGNVEYGLVVQSGDRGTIVAPIVNNYVITEAVTTSDLGATHVREYMKQLLKQKYEGHVNLDSPAFDRVLKEAIKQHAFCKGTKRDDFYPAELGCNLPDVTAFSDFGLFQQFPNEMIEKVDTMVKDHVLGVKFESPEGHTVVLSALQRRECVEVLFNPSLLQSDKTDQIPSIPELIIQSLQKCQSSDWPNIVSRLVVIGGNTLYPGFENRLVHELSTKLNSENPDNPVNIKLVTMTREERTHAVWKGAAKLANVNTDQPPIPKLDLSRSKYSPLYQGAWLSKEEYDELGKQNEKSQRSNCDTRAEYLDSQALLAYHVMSTEKQVANRVGKIKALVTSYSPGNTLNNVEQVHKKEFASLSTNTV